MKTYTFLILICSLLLIGCKSDDYYYYDDYGPCGGGVPVYGQADEIYFTFKTLNEEDTIKFVEYQIDWYSTNHVDTTITDTLIKSFLDLQDYYGKRILSLEEINRYYYIPSRNYKEYDIDILMPNGETYYISHVQRLEKLMNSSQCSSYYLEYISFQLNGEIITSDSLLFVDL